MVAGPRQLVIRAEIVERTERLWCRVCALPSGARLVFAYHYPGGRMLLAVVMRCRDCGGDQVDTEGA